MPIFGVDRTAEQLGMPIKVIKLLGSGNETVEVHTSILAVKLTKVPTLRPSHLLVSIGGPSPKHEERYVTLTMPVALSFISTEDEIF